MRDVIIRGGRCPGKSADLGRRANAWLSEHRIRPSTKRPILRVGLPVARLPGFFARPQIRLQQRSQHWFTDRDEVQGVLGHWRDYYNNHGPHSALGARPPAMYRAGEAETTDRSQLDGSGKRKRDRLFRMDCSWGAGHERPPARRHGVDLPPCPPNDRGSPATSRLKADRPSPTAPAALSGATAC